MQYVLEEGTSTKRGAEWDGQGVNFALFSANATEVELCLFSEDGKQELESADDLTFDERDSAPFVPKCIVIDPNFDFSGERGRKHVHWDETIFYELHAKGFTKRRSDIPEHLRGTYAGLAESAVIDYVRSIGVTSVELLPVHSFVDDSHLLEKGLSNYWGYNTIGFFAPDPRYASDRPNTLREFKEMVARYHEAGLEIILDVVYNHTAEGNEKGPTLSFKGIDNKNYYRLLPDQPRYYINETGTGNTLNVSHPRVLQMVMDSLRYWVDATSVDGFRFDLGTTLGREIDGFDPGGGFLKACSQDPLLGSVKLIAEPWDCGPGGYQVGSFPAGWAEWNDRFRDTVRDFWREHASASDLAVRLAGSGDLFNHEGRKTWASVNLITAHDGFTLNDLVSYNEKHNEANGDNNTDGISENRSWNCGVEGLSADPEINRLRVRQIKNFLATLLLAQGTPLLLAGDEFGRSQEGNNNAYCQDNEISWLDRDLNERGKEILSFAQSLTALRHKFPVLRRSRFCPDPPNEGHGLKHLTWINANGNEMQQEHWDDPSLKCFGLLMDGRAQKTGIPRQGDDATLLFVINGYHDVVDFVLPHYDTDEWVLIMDTNLARSFQLTESGSSVARYSVTARSVLLFGLRSQISGK